MALTAFGKIIVSIVPTIGFSSDPGKTFFITQNLQLNRSQTNTWNSDGALQSVAIHEFGHSLGLDHRDGAVIMNPYT